MTIKVIHDTIYKFDKDVFLEPHTIRLKPTSIEYRVLSKFDLQIEPQPSGVRQLIDEEGNTIHFAWFNDMVGSLHIRSHSLIETSSFNAFNFLIYPYDFQTIPFNYSKKQNLQLYATLLSLPLGEGLIEYGKHIERHTKAETLSFLTMLTEKIHEDFNVIYRELGEPFSPDKTFELKEGSCRDLSWMQIHLLRSMGIASRFVSGYFYLDSDSFELHAWIEVFIPGAGWLGFDPSHGITTGNSHIPVVAAANYENTMPVTGTFRGEAKADLKNSVLIEKID